MIKNKEIISWSSENNKDFFPSRPMLKGLPSGIYSLDYSMEYGPFLSSIEDKNDKMMEIINSYYNILKKDLDKFHTLEKKYRGSGIEYNRAIMLYGEPGCGKKYLCKRLSKYFIEKYNGVVIYVEDPTDLKKIITSIKQTENKNNNILVIIQDIGNSLEKYGISIMTNMFKDINNEDGVYIVATTNYEDRISEYLSDKPGIFEQKMLIDYPDELERKSYIKKLSELLEVKVNIETVSNDTENLSLGHIKNLIESSFLFGYNYEETLEELKTMKENISSSHYPSNTGNNDTEFDDD